MSTALLGATRVAQRGYGFPPARAGAHAASPGPVAGTISAPEPERIQFGVYLQLRRGATGVSRCGEVGCGQNKEDNIETQAGCLSRLVGYGTGTRKSLH